MNILGINPALLQIEFFEYPYVLWLLVLLPICVWFSWRYSHLSFRRLFAPELPESSKHGPEQEHTVSGVPLQLKGVFQSFRFFSALIAVIAMAGCYICMVLALAGPVGISPLNGLASGSDIYIVMDMSASMKAFDVDFTGRDKCKTEYVTSREVEGGFERLRRGYERGEVEFSRYNVARYAMLEFIQMRSIKCHDVKIGARCDRIGIALFGQDAFIDVPLTTNYDLLSTHMELREIDDIDASQSAIGDGMMRAIASLRNSESGSKSIILFTDGDRKGGRISVEQAIAAANLYNIQVYPILVGEKETAFIVEKQPNGCIEYTQATFPMNEPLLKKIASQTHGQYFRATNDKELLNQLSYIMDSLQPTVMQKSEDNSHTELALVFILMSLILGMLAYFLYMIAVRHYP